MKHLIALLLAALLLCGCAADSPAEEATVHPLETEATAAPTMSPVGLYDAGSELETATNGAVRTYPLNFSDAFGMCAMGENLLIFSGSENTALTVLSGEELYVTANIGLDFPLTPDDTSLRVSGSGISYYDPVRQQTVVLDASLKEISHIAAPEDLVGRPILSADRNTLYYCTANAIRAWNLETGIRRVIKEAAYSEQTITGLHWEDTVLQCTITDDAAERTLFLSTETGRLLYEKDGDMTLITSGTGYYAAFPTGMTQALLFGEGVEEQPLALMPNDITAECVFLEAIHAAVTVSQGDMLRLDCYDLETGCRRSLPELTVSHAPLSIDDTDDGFVYILLYDESYGRETLYRWNISALPLTDDTVCTGVYRTEENPDYNGIAQCQAYAAEIGSKYGIEVLVWEDALAVQPWDYDLEAEHLVPVIQWELERLDQHLAQYPDGILETTASHFTSLKICLVRSLTGTAESGSLAAAAGVQFFDGTDAYVVLAAGKSSEKTLYHELYHVMETHILNESIAFDQWEKMNPEGFAYDYDYAANARRDGSAYLQTETRSFIDTYSMSFPKEDRARIMEYAMTEGNEALFQSPYMQAKLSQLCLGIREAYDLEKSEETFLWEQYLH